jgi:hypothetical protein
MVETALSLVLLLVLLVGMVDFGLAFGHRVALFNAARTGARFGARYPVNVVEATGAKYFNVDKIACVTLSALAGTLVLTEAEGTCDLNDDLFTTGSLPEHLSMEITYVDATGNGLPDRGEELTVLVAYDYQPAVLTLIGVGPVPVRAQVTMVIAGPDILYEP